MFSSSVDQNQARTTETQFKNTFLCFLGHPSIPWTTIFQMSSSLQCMHTCLFYMWFCLHHALPYFQLSVAKLGNLHCIGRNLGLLGQWWPWHPGHARGQLCALAMCCHLLSAMMPDPVLGISCFWFYFLVIEVNQQLSNGVQSHIWSLYCLYSYSTDFQRCTHRCTNNPFLQLCFLSSLTPMSSRGQVFSLKKREVKKRKKKNGPDEKRI